MSIRRDIPLEEFEIIISPPSNRLASMCVNIYEDGKFNLNGKLAAKIGGKKLGIRLTRDGKYLCLIENGDIAFPKSGSCKIPEVTTKLKDASKIMDVSLLDHLILCGDNYYSFADENMM